MAFSLPELVNILFTGVVTGLSVALGVWMAFRLDQKKMREERYLDRRLSRAEALRDQVDEAKKAIAVLRWQHRLDNQNRSGEGVGRDRARERVAFARLEMQVAAEELFDHLAGDSSEMREQLAKATKGLEWSEERARDAMNVWATFSSEDALTAADEGVAGLRSLVIDQIRRDLGR